MTGAADFLATISIVMFVIGVPIGLVFFLYSTRGKNENKSDD